MIGSLIITYNPEIELLQKNLLSTHNQIERILIVDNGSQNIDNITKLLSKLDFNVEIIKLERNSGIAFALNIGIKFFKEKGFGWVLTLDQDSILPIGYVDKLSQRKEFKLKDTGILGAKYQDISRNELISNYKDEIVNNPFLITSGSLTNIEAWENIGGFDNQLFIDVVDHDFNQRLIDNGYKVLQDNSIVFNHHLGSAVKRPMLKSLLLIKKDFNPSDHSKFRQYYIYRNSIIFIKRYSKKPLWHIIILFTTLRMLLLFQDPFTKLIFALRGFIDGVCYFPSKDVFFQEYLKKERKIFKK